MVAPLFLALPDGVAVLTAGVDVQGDRLELHVVGWGRDEESWSIDYRVNVRSSPVMGEACGALSWTGVC